MNIAELVESIRERAEHSPDFVEGVARRSGLSTDTLRRYLAGDSLPYDVAVEVFQAFAAEAATIDRDGARSLVCVGTEVEL